MPPGLATVLWGLCAGAALSALSVLGPGCGGDETSATGGAGGAGGSGGTGGQGATTTTGGAGQGGEPILHPGVLVDEGLVARYYLDEADSGQGPSEVVDAVPDPLSLPLTYVNVDTEEFMAYFEDDDGNRGLAFAAHEHDDRASIAVDGTKIASALQGAQAVTYEVVASVQDASWNSSRLLHIGEDVSHTLSLETDGPTRIQFALNEHTVGGVPVDLRGLGRAVFHGIVDTTQSEPVDRIRIYVNGARLPSVEGTPPPLDETIELGSGRHFVIGNREIGARSIEGAIYYAAVYSEPLTDDQVLQNVALLLLDDDTPAGGSGD